MAKTPWGDYVTTRTSSPILKARQNYKKPSEPAYGQEADPTKNAAKYRMEALKKRMSR